MPGKRIISTLIFKFFWGRPRIDPARSSGPSALAIGGCAPAVCPFPEVAPPIQKSCIRPWVIKVICIRTLPINSDIPFMIIESSQTKCNYYNDEGTMELMYFSFNYILQMRRESLYVYVDKHSVGPLQLQSNWLLSRLVEDCSCWTCLCQDVNQEINLKCINFQGIMYSV
jgi:hypothetical protein